MEFIILNIFPHFVVNWMKKFSDEEFLDIPKFSMNEIAMTRNLKPYWKNGTKVWKKIFEMILIWDY